MTNGWLFPPLTTSLLALFWRMVEAWDPTPVRPARNGRLLLSLMRPLRFGSVIGTPPLIGKMLLLGLVKGRPLIWVSAIIPVTTLADGCVPPRMSCMKKVNGGLCGTGFATVAVEVPVTGTGPVGDVVVGPATGATPATGVGMVLGSGSGSGCGDSTSGSIAGLFTGVTGIVSTSGVSGSGCGESTSGSTTGLATGATGSGGSVSSATVVGVVATVVVAVAGIWPLGNVVVEPTFGTVVVVGLDNWDGLGRMGGCGSTTSRILAELAHPRVMDRNKRYTVALSVLVVRRESLAIFGCRDGYSRRECLNVLLLLRMNSLWMYL